MARIRVIQRRILASSQCAVLVHCGRPTLSNISMVFLRRRANVRLAQNYALACVTHVRYFQYKLS
jgi:hypothetical protein